jgi:hypothetical protein
MLLLHLPHAYRKDWWGPEMDSFLNEVTDERKGAAY